MEISRMTRTHLIYQFIIVTLVFLGIGYNELLPDRKFILFLAFLPIFCYQLMILSCCTELIPVPSWMSFLLLVSNDANTGELKSGKDFESSSSSITKSKVSCTQSKEFTFPQVPEILPFSRRWEKSVTNLGASPKCVVYPQKSKSWMNLSNSRSSERLSREASLDTLVSQSESSSPKVQNKDYKTKREERAVKARSWKPSITSFDISEKAEFVKSVSSIKGYPELPSTSSSAEQQQEESELEKSFSFPFRQKRLQSWLEMKETNVRPLNQNPDMPYWQTVGYNLAVKYEARRRRRAISIPSKADVPNENLNFRRSLESVPEPVSIDRRNHKKSSKSAVCMNKIKVGFSNLISKKKEEGSDNSSGNSNKINRPALFKLKNKSTSSQTKIKESITVPELPQFLSNDRPLIFYPKYLPFDKERFESDVKKKMVELEEPKGNVQQLF